MRGGVPGRWVPGWYQSMTLFQGALPCWFVQCLPGLGSRLSQIFMHSQ